MKDVKNRIPLYPNRKKITYENGEEELVTIEYADEPLEQGTPIDEALFKSIKGDVYRIDKYTQPTYNKGETESDTVKTGSYIGLWGNSHYSKFGINVSASNEDGENYAYRAMSGVEGYWSGNSVPTVATPTLFTIQLYKPIAVKKFSISGSDTLYCKNFKLQGSNDGDNYYDIISISNNTKANTEYSANSNEYYKYYRLNITASGSENDYPAILEFNITSWKELTEYNKIVLNEIPLTEYKDKQRLLLDIKDDCDTRFESNILPPMMFTRQYGFLIQSSGDYINTSVIDAFDYDIENSYWRSLGTQTERYIMITMPINVIPSRFKIKIKNISNGKIQGSTDGDNWNNLVSKISTSDDTNIETQEFDVANASKYRYFRFLFNAKEENSSSYIYDFEIPYGYISGFDYHLKTYIDINSLGDRAVDTDSISEEGNYEFVYDSNLAEFKAYLNSFARKNIENTYTASEKEKLAGIEVGAEVNIIDGVKINGKEYLPDSNRVISINGIEMTENKVDDLDGSTTHYPSCKAVENGLKNAGQYLTMDTYPIENSENPITSGGVYQVIGNVETLLSRI